MRILSGCEFLTSLVKDCQIFGPLNTIESIPSLTVDLHLVINVLGFFKEYK